MIKTLFKVKTIYYILIRTIFFLFITLNTASFCYSQIMPVPENIQAALLPKVLKFNPNFAQKTKIRMLIVYDNDSQTSKEDLINGLGASIDAKAIHSNELEQNISNCDLVYFMPGIQDESAICKSHKILSVTGISQYVEKGQISIGFGILNNKPKIFISLSSLEKEGQSISSELLRIAKVFN